MNSFQPSGSLALIVDDDPFMRLLAREALEGAGWNIAEADTGLAAVAAVERLGPTVVCLDVMMPQMDGFAACMAIRQLPGGEDIPIVIMTGLDDYESIERAYEAGATDFLTKPINGPLLRHRLRYIVRASQIARELRSTQAILTQARDAALEGSRMKSEFMANVSHELRTPLNGVLGMAELLLSTRLTHDQNEWAEIIRSSGTRLLSVIEDILDFSKAESGRLSLTCADFDVRTLMRGVAGLYEEAARGKGLAMTVSVDATVPAMMRGDEKRLQQVVRHLLDNAVKFSDEGSIAVTVDIGDGGRGRQRRDRGRAAASPPRVSPGDTELVHIAIADSGIGVPPDSAPWLFQPFRQADGSSTRRYGGAGLGLAICKQLVERMGGAIWFDSEVGHGSVFHVTLPLVRCAAVANQPT